MWLSENSTLRPSRKQRSLPPAILRRIVSVLQRRIRAASANV